MRSKKFYEIFGKLADSKKQVDDELVEGLLKIRRLAFKHTRLAEMDCNGEGYVRGRFYRCDGSTPGAYVDEDTTIFSAESDKVESKIKSLADSLALAVEFQGDPRGYTVKINLEGSDISHLVLS